MDVRLTIHNTRPYFAELPYYLWGEINYDSDGDCHQPTDQQWTFLDVTNRITHERVHIEGASSSFVVRSNADELAARSALFLIDRSEAIPERDDLQHISGAWSRSEALKRTHRIQAEFPRSELKPFDSHLFWGSWKWVGWYATDFTWVGRWIMNSVLTRDARAVFLCVEWLRNGTVHQDQSTALRHALATLTGKSFYTDAQWLEWYNTIGKQTYPEPDTQVWLEDLKRE